MTKTKTSYSDVALDVQIKEDNEKRIIAYLLENPSEALELQIEYFIHPIARASYYAVRNLIERGAKIDDDTLVSLAQEVEPNFSYDHLKDVRSVTYDFDNIEIAKEILVNDHLRHTLSKKFSEDVATMLSRRDLLDVEKLKEIGQDIVVQVSNLRESIQLYDGKALAKHYRESQRRRASGESQRSIGYLNLDEFLIKPGAPQEMTLIGGMKGSLKSAFTKNIEKNLVAQGQCVLSFNPEMSEESSVDRFVCMRNGALLRDLVKQHKSAEENLMIERTLEELEQWDNYLYCPNETLNLATIDATIYRAKNIFAKKGLLPSDGYIFVVVDLFSMVQDFGNLKPEDIVHGVNLTHQMIRKHNVHLLGVVQANENKLRTGKMFKKVDDLDSYKIGMEDIYGGAEFAARARTVIMLNRPLFMKRRFFPELEDELKFEKDILNAHVVKQNDGDIGMVKFRVSEPNRPFDFHIRPLAKDEQDFRRMSNNENAVEQVSSTISNANAPPDQQYF